MVRYASSSSSSITHTHTKHNANVKRRKARDAILTNKRFKCSKSFPMQWHVVFLNTIKQVDYVEGSRRFSIMFGQPLGAKPRSSSSFGNVLRRKSSRTDSSEPQVMYFQTSDSSQSAEWVRLIREAQKQLLMPQLLKRKFDEEMRSLTNTYSESPIIMASSSDDEEENDDDDDNKTKESTKPDLTDVVDEDMHVPLPQVKKLNIKNLNMTTTWIKMST